MIADAPITVKDLPDPDRYPDRSVVIWDGDCGFCKSQVAKLHSMDTGKSLSYISLHDPRVAERYGDLSHEQLMEQLWLVTTDGRRLGGADAVRFLSRRITRMWWLAPWLHIPFSMPLWRVLYRAVANRRYRLSESQCAHGGTCHLHDRASARKD
ncbi:MAG: DUF393 domain-containing protein [Planctomycetales bacterium]|nr:DUF393 domain-containing protein [Planctomycetales bacterium]